MPVIEIGIDGYLGTVPITQGLTVCRADPGSLLAWQDAGLLYVGMYMPEEHRHRLHVIELAVEAEVSKRQVAQYPHIFAAARVFMGKHAAIPENHKHPGDPKKFLSTVVPQLVAAGVDRGAAMQACVVAWMCAAAQGLSDGMLSGDPKYLNLFPGSDGN